MLPTATADRDLSAAEGLSFRSGINSRRMTWAIPHKDCGADAQSEISTDCPMTTKEYFRIAIKLVFFTVKGYGGIYASICATKPSGDPCAVLPLYMLMTSNLAEIAEYQKNKG